MTTTSLALAPWTDANPWTDAYLDRELATMNTLTPFDDGRLVLKEQHVLGIVQCYLRDDFMDWGPFPWLGERLGTDSSAQVWMSITPQEIESQYMPIRLARGRVGVGGLGLGYVVQRMLSKPEVDELVVYEQNPAVIALYERNFGHHPKLQLVAQDVGTMHDETFDLFYNDVYASMLETQTFTHWRHLTEANDIGCYHPWGLEALLMSFVRASRQGEVPFVLRHVYFPFLQQLLVAIREADYGVLSERCIMPVELARDLVALLGEDIWDA